MTPNRRTITQAEARQRIGRQLARLSLDCLLFSYCQTRVEGAKALRSRDEDLVTVAALTLDGIEAELKRRDPIRWLAWSTSDRPDPRPFFERPLGQA